QAGLITEVIVDGGDVGAGALADLSDSRVMKPEFGKHFSRRVDQTGTRLLVSRLCRRHSNDNLKRLFESVKQKEPQNSTGDTDQALKLGPIRVSRCASVAAKSPALFLAGLLWRAFLR